MVDLRESIAFESQSAVVMQYIIRKHGPWQPLFIRGQNGKGFSYVFENQHVMLKNAWLGTKAFFRTSL